MRRLLLILLLVQLAGARAWAVSVSGYVTDGQSPIAGVRVYPDRLHRPLQKELTPLVITDAAGCFRLDIGDTDSVLVLEKSGWQRDFVPIAELGQPVVLHKASEFRVEKVLLVRLDFPDECSAVSDEDLKARLFCRQPNVSSAANYLYEVSKGSLELEEGTLLHLKDPEHSQPRTDEHLADIARWVLGRIKELPLGDLDVVNNRTGELKPDGKPDHLWIVTPGAAQTVTHDHARFTPYSLMKPLPWNSKEKWPVLFFPEETPLGNIVHEAFHTMGELRVDDFYLDENHPDTAGMWDLMDVGMYRGWDCVHPKTGPWFGDMAYSPSQPMGWTRAELWYYGRFRETVKTETVKGKAWTGWIDPLERAPGQNPQRIVVRDSRKKGCFWEFDVRRPWGFDRGRVGNRWGPGYEGLVVARVEPSKLTLGEPKGPVHVMDAHPGTPQPEQPRPPNGRWQLDDAAFNLGVGEVAKGSDGPLAWEVLAVDASGRMRVRVRVRTPRPRH